MIDDYYIAFMFLFNSHCNLYKGSYYLYILWMGKQKFMEKNLPKITWFVGGKTVRSEPGSPTCSAVLTPG